MGQIIKHICSETRPETKETVHYSHIVEEANLPPTYLTRNLLHREIFAHLISSTYSQFVFQDLQSVKSKIRWAKVDFYISLFLRRVDWIYQSLPLLGTVIKRVHILTNEICRTHLQRHLAVPIFPLPLPLAIPVTVPLTVAVPLTAALPVVVLVTIPAAGLVAPALFSGAAVVALSGPLPPKRGNAEVFTPRSLSALLTLERSLLWGLIGVTLQK